MEGLVLRGLGGFYTVLDDMGEKHTLRAQGKIRRQRMTPMVGDRVRFTPGQGEEEGWLEAILPRKNSLVRPPVSNIDVMCLVLAAASPQPDTLLIDKMLIACAVAGIDTFVAVNKGDMDETSAEDLCAQYRLAAKGVFPLTARTGDGVDALREALRGRIHAFGGQSGVGKSTLVNALYGLSMETGGVSEKIERGKHTTRRCELIDMGGGTMVLDTPGFSLMELPLIDPETLPALYAELAPFEGKCRFTPCSHRSEPGCAAKAALPDGAMHPKRYERYLTIYEEVLQKWRDRYD